MSEEEEENLFGRVEYTICDLTANLMRVMRGAGKPYEVMSQIEAFQNAVSDYNTRAGKSFTPRDLSYALSLGRHLNERNQSYGTVIRGALQLTASTLLKQSHQQSEAIAEIRSGFRRD